MGGIAPPLNKRLHNWKGGYGAAVTQTTIAGKGGIAEALLYYVLAVKKDRKRNGRYVGVSWRGIGD